MKRIGPGRPAGAERWDEPVKGDTLLDENTLLGQLEELARSLSIDLRYEPIKKEGSFYPGGLCRLKGEYVLIINSTASIRDRILALTRAVSRFDLSRVYLRPGLREHLGRFPKESGVSSEDH